MRLVDWCRHGKHKLWTNIELNYSLVPLHRASWCYHSLQSSLKTHSTIDPTLRIGHNACQNPTLSSTSSPLFPIIGHPGFVPGFDRGNFQNLARQGCFQAFHFLLSKAWPSIPDLTNSSSTYRLNTWQALQLQHFFHSLGPLARFSWALTTYEELCSEGDPPPPRPV